jgi:multiple sugar transport system substrate-binding protein
MDLTRDQPIPVYYQLKTLLTEEILGGVYGTDGRLPTEHELCARFGLSRTPVTHALTDLAAEGVVLRRRRHGTFVNPQWLARRADPGEVRALTPIYDRWELYDRWGPHLRASSPGAPLLVTQAEVNDLHGVFLRAVAEGKPPDLAILDSVWVAEFAASGVLWPLEELDRPWVDNELRRDFLEPFADAHRIGSGTFALLASNGTGILGQDGVTLDSPAGVEAMRLLRTLADDGVLSAATGDHVRDQPIYKLAKGEALMAFGGSYEAPALAAFAGLDLDELTDTFGFVRVPAGPRGQSSVLVGGYAYCIPRQARQPGAAMEVLKSAVTAPAMTRFFARTGQIPPRRSVSAELVGRSPFHAFTTDLLGGAVTRPVTPAYALVSVQLREMLDAVLTARLSPEQAVSTAAGLISAVIGLPPPPLCFDPGLAPDPETPSARCPAGSSPRCSRR